LIQKLERRIRDLDADVKRSLSYDGWDRKKADDRELLEEALKAVKFCHQQVCYERLEQ